MLCVRRFCMDVCTCVYVSFDLSTATDTTETKYLPKELETDLRQIHRQKEKRKGKGGGDGQWERVENINRETWWRKMEDGRRQWR